METLSRMSTMKKILLITIEDTYLAPKFEGGKEYHVASKLDIARVIDLLSDYFEVEHINLPDFDISRNYKNYYVIYPSCERRGLFYKGFIEDLLIKLEKDGAILIPRFELFRAHANKVCQELIRSSFHSTMLRKPQSFVIGKFEDLEADRFISFPYVVKSASGSGSSGVILAKNKEEFISAVKKLSEVTYLDYYYTNRRDFFYLPVIWLIKVLVYKMLGKPQSLTHPKRVMNDNKVIIQEFIEGLDSDFKVLYYFGKYFVLNRKNRVNDFRASGSGKFVFPADVAEIENILNFAEICSKEIDAPMISMDIGRTATGACYLIEFQCLDFGPYTIQFSDWHFRKGSRGWEKVVGKIDLETETVQSIIQYIDELQRC